MYAAAGCMSMSCASWTLIAEEPRGLFSFSSDWELQVREVTGDGSGGEWGWLEAFHVLLCNCVLAFLGLFRSQCPIGGGGRFRAEGLGVGVCWGLSSWGFGGGLGLTFLLYILEGWRTVGVGGGGGALWVDMGWGGVGACVWGWFCWEGRQVEGGGEWCTAMV